jgi:transcriptional regulator GlxA family with amidase domain
VSDVRKHLAILAFPGFQTLDMFGPLEMWGALRDQLDMSVVAATADPVPSVHGMLLGVDHTIRDEHTYDYLFIPGGDSALEAAKDTELVNWISRTADAAELVMTVCTGSILLAVSGALDGRSATTNKIDFTDTIHLGPNVDWVPVARWVEDGKFFTSSGVSAGMDMALGAIAHVHGRAVALEIAEGSEYEWHDDPSWDPFAVSSGLVSEP